MTRLGGFLPLVAELWPTSISAMAAPFATGSAVHQPTIASWALALGAIGAVGLISFDRDDM